MPDTAEAALATPLRRYLRALWNVAPRLHFEADGTFIAGGALHLPAALAGPPSDPLPIDSWPGLRAAAAHATAHLVYSPPEFDGADLRPLARALVGLLEDARIEALAMRELPGLRRLWAPLHTASPTGRDDLETLLLRLARSLIDPSYDDPHSWVRKGRALFFADAGMEVLAVHQPAALRDAADSLAHDLDRMWRGAIPPALRPGPGYRDDHRWMWRLPMRESG